jgi:hypothetical protein
MDIVFLSGQSGFTVALFCDEVQRWPTAPSLYLL